VGCHDQAAEAGQVRSEDAFKAGIIVGAVGAWIWAGVMFLTCIVLVG
jgi:hypothetical protein